MYVSLLYYIVSVVVNSVDKIHVNMTSGKLDFFNHQLPP